MTHEELKRLYTEALEKIEASKKENENCELSETDKSESVVFKKDLLDKFEVNARKGRANVCTEVIMTKGKLKTLCELFGEGFKVLVIYPEYRINAHAITVSNNELSTADGWKTLHHICKITVTL